MVGLDQLIINLYLKNLDCNYKGLLCSSFINMVQLSLEILLIYTCIQNRLNSFVTHGKSVHLITSKGERNKLYMNIIMKGGMKLINPEKHGFVPIYDMIKDSTSELSVLSTTSSRGFMIKLTVNRGISEYEFIDTANVKFITITEFILKITVLSIKGNDSLPLYTGFKTTENHKSFFNEAKMQYNIWKWSTMGVSDGICPPVANFSLFDNRTANLFVDYLFTKTEEFRPLHKVLEYLKCNLDQYGLGVIVMPMIQSSTTLERIYDSHMYDFEKQVVYTKAIVKLMRLFMLGIIHYDLHLNNILVYDDTDGKNVLLIDFGMVSNVNEELGDNFLSKKEKSEICDIVDTFNQTLKLFSDDISDDKKIKFIVDSLNLIVHLYKNRIIKWASPSVIRDVDKIEVFDALKFTITKPKQSLMSDKAFESYENAGYFIDFNKRIYEFYATMPGVPIPKKETMCVISGGKNKSRRKNKKRKTLLNKICTSFSRR